MNFRERIPSLAQFLPVYAVAVSILYGFSIIRFFWRVPSLINYSTTGQVGVVFSYMLAVNFIESLMVILAPVFFSVVLPRKWFYDQFVAKATIMIVLVLGYMYYISLHINTIEPFPYHLFRLLPFIFIGIAVMVIILPRINPLNKFLEWISDQLTIFVYLSIPLSTIAVLVVIVRNLN